MLETIKRVPLVGHALDVATSSLFTNAFYLMLSQAILAILGFAFWVVVARYYTEAEVGYSSAIISMLGLANLIGHIGLDTFLVRFLPRSENPSRLVNTCVVYAGAATLVSGLVIVAVQSLGSSEIAFVARQPVFFGAFVLFAVVGSVSGLLGSAYVAYRRSSFLAIKSAVMGSVKLLLPLAFVGYFRAFGIVASWGLGSLVALVISVIFLAPRAIPNYVLAFETGARLVRRAWGFSGLSYVSSIVGASPKYVMPLIVINALGPEENGYFYIAWAMASVLHYIPGSVAQSLFAEGSNDRRTVRHNVGRAFQIGFAILLPCIAILLLFGDKILLAFGQTYSERSLQVLHVLVLVGIPSTIERIYFAVLRVYGKVMEVLVWRIAITTAVLSASAYAVGVGGLEGIGWAVLAVHCAMAALILVLRWRVWLQCRR